MGRIRTIKPEFFAHEDLFTGEKETGLPLRLAYAGLWTVADREGRFKWKPMQLKTAALPYDDVDFSRVLDALVTRGFIFKYEVSGVFYGVILSWKANQFINNKEPQSSIPAPPQILIDQQVDAIATRRVRDFHASLTRGVKEGKGKEVINPLPPLGPAALIASQENQNPETELDIDPWQAGQATAELLGLGGQQKALARDACAAVKRRKPEMRFTDIPAFVCALWREYDSLAVHAKVSLKTFLGEIGRFIDSDSWRTTANNARAAPELDEHGGHYEYNGPQKVYVTKDGKRLPGYIPLPKAKGASAT